MSVLSLYDTRDGNVLTAAYQRMEQPPLDAIEAAVVRPHTLSAVGEAQMTITARITDGTNSAEMQILFRLVDNVWLRAS